MKELLCWNCKKNVYEWGLVAKLLCVDVTREYEWSDDANAWVVKPEFDIISKSLEDGGRHTDVYYECQNCGVIIDGGHEVNAMGDID